MIVAHHRTNIRRLLLCASWQSRHGLCVTGLCCRSDQVSSWQAKHILGFGINKVRVVMSPLVRARWQTVHESSLAECTDLPLDLSA